MNKLRVLIADDELLARKRLARLLAEMDDVELVGMCQDGVEVLQRVAQGGVDVLLLDIQMPRLTGLEVMALKSHGLPAVVFTTAWAEHAVQAFDQDAADYLLKPVEGDRLARALQRARRQVQALSAAEPEAPACLPDKPFPRLPIPTRKGVVLVDPEAITHAEIEGVSCLVHTADESWVTDFRLADLEKRLPADRFLRLHRQVLVSLYQIERLEPQDSGGYLAHLRGGARVAVSRKAARQLRQWWESSG